MLLITAATIDRTRARVRTLQCKAFTCADKRVKGAKYVKQCSKGNVKLLITSPTYGGKVHLGLEPMTYMLFRRTS